MTLHPRPLPRNSGQIPAEVPGLAYYTASPAKPVRIGIEKAAPSAAAEALAAMFGYYTPQD